MAYFIQICFAGIALGCIYALIALGFTIIVKSSGVINFAQGELLLLGAYLVFAGVYEWHLGFFLALVVALAGTIAIGVLFERFVLRRMIGRPVFSILMMTIGLDILLRTFVIGRWGGDIHPPGVPYNPNDTVTPGITFADGQVHFLVNDLWTIVVTVLLCAALFGFFRYTRYGLAMRAAAIDQEAALAMGINVRTVNALAWAIAAGIATIGGVFFAANQFTVSPTLGTIALLAFPAIILGGIDSVTGAVVGGLVIGLAELLTSGYETHVFNLAGTTFRASDLLGQNFHTIAPYLVMIAVLLVRPYGLFGTRKVERI